MTTSYACSKKIIRDLDCNLRDQMYKLLAANFHNVDWLRFCNDLESKDFVFLMRDLSGNLAGFSTQKLLHTDAGDLVVFSGDTIIDPAAWGSLEFPKTWGLWMLSIQKSNPKLPLYWLLISKGQRTYRYLSTFFIDFAPKWDRTYSAEEIKIIKEIGAGLFGGDLVRDEKGYLFVKAGPESQYLKEHLLDYKINSTKKTAVDFFESVNPNYYKGSELVCFLQFSPHNMRPFCRRMLGLNPNATGDHAHVD